MAICPSVFYLVEGVITTQTKDSREGTLVALVLTLGIKVLERK
jgi:hypothetical protein